MKFKKEWDLILVVQSVSIIYGALIYFANPVAGLSLIIFGTGFTLYEYLRQEKTHKKLYAIIQSNNRLPLVFKHEILSSQKDHQNVWAYYDCQGLDLGFKIPAHSDFSNLLVESKYVIQNFNNKEIHIRK